MGVGVGCAINSSLYIVALVVPELLILQYVVFEWWLLGFARSATRALVRSGTDVGLRTPGVPVHPKVSREVKLGAVCRSVFFHTNFGKRGFYGRAGKGWRFLSSQ